MLKLANSNRTFSVAADQSAAEALQAAGVPVDIKCSDGICGVCSATVLAGDVDHRDHVLSASERTTKMLLCCSRAAQPGGELTVSL
jgi:ferredoxin